MTSLVPGSLQQQLAVAKEPMVTSLTPVLRKFLDCIFSLYFGYENVMFHSSDIRVFFLKLELE